MNKKSNIQSLDFYNHKYLKLSFYSPLQIGFEKEV